MRRGGWGGPACSAHLLLTSLVQQGERAGGPWGILKAWSQLGFKGAGAPQGRLLAGGAPPGVTLEGREHRARHVSPAGTWDGGHRAWGVVAPSLGVVAPSSGVVAHMDTVTPIPAGQRRLVAPVLCLSPVVGWRDLGVGGGDTAWGPPAVAQGHRGQLGGWQGGLCCGDFHVPVAWGQRRAPGAAVLGRRR